jgi:hypothetical protein
MSIETPNNINEATGAGMSSGRFTVPLSPGVRIFKKKELDPFIVNVSKYNDAELAYDSYDGKLDVSKKTAQKIEKKALKISKFIEKHPSGNDDDGDILNQGVGKIVESDKANIGQLIKDIYPIIIKASKIQFRSGKYFSVDDAKKDILHKIKNGDEDVFDFLTIYCGGMYKDKFIEDIQTLKKLTKNKLNEDLAVWFGTKKKPKGSKQPKGPWVNICRKVNGKHPPCGRPEASDRGYPKCRAAGVAGKMSDSQKRAACQQKRKAEKTHSKTGTGNSPKMVHYEPKKKKNESFKDRLLDILIEVVSNRDITA